jgi:hypothetical protein
MWLLHMSGNQHKGIMRSAACMAPGCPCVRLLSMWLLPWIVPELQGPAMCHAGMLMDPQNCLDHSDCSGCNTSVRCCPVLLRVGSRGWGGSTGGWLVDCRHRVTVCEYVLQCFVVFVDIQRELLPARLPVCLVFGFQQGFCCMPGQRRCTLV